MAYIEFDKINKRLKRPILLLETPNGNILGKIKYSDFAFNLSGSQLSEISFSIHKFEDGKLNNLWDKCTGIKIAEWQDLGCFEASFSISDEDETIKTCVATALETELNNRKLYDFHVNDGDEIDSTSSTVFYDKNNTSKSLLHRALKDKAPQWELDDDNIAKYFNVNGSVEPADQIVRQYTVDGESIYEFFTNDITAQLGCVFTFDTRGGQRKIGCQNADTFVYKISDMKVIDGAYVDKGIMYYKDGTAIPNQSEYSYVKGIGEDTTIYLSKKKFVNSFNVDYNKDEVKNCFRISGGDDIINDTIGAINGTGNRYIYMFDNFQYDDMSSELVSGIKNYQTSLEKSKENFLKEGGVYIYDSTCRYDSNKDACLNKNGKVLSTAKHYGSRVYIREPLCEYTLGQNTSGEIVPTYVWDKDGNDITSQSYLSKNENEYYVTNNYYVVCDSGIYIKYSDLKDKLSYWEHTRFPKTKDMEDITATDAMNTIFSNLTNIYVNLDSTEESFVNVTNTIESVAKVICDTRYDLKILNDSDHKVTCTAINSGNKTGTWTGTIKLVRQTDEADKIEKSISVSVTKAITDDELMKYASQKMDIAIAKMDIAELDFNNLSDAELKDLLKQYNLNSLKSFVECFNSCQTTIKNLYDNLTTKNVNEYNQSIDPSLNWIDANKSLHTGDIWINNGVRKQWDGTKWVSVTQDVVSDTGKELQNKYAKREQICKEVRDSVSRRVDKYKGQIEYYEGYEGENGEWHEGKIQEFYKQNSIQNYITDALWKEFCIFVREDTYENSNYISDNLTTAELILKVKELLNTAEKELKKACKIQKTISGDINDIFTDEQLDTMLDKFCLYNYVWAKIDDEVYKLRLIEMGFNENNPEKLDVTFTDIVEDLDGNKNDLQSLVKNVSSISGSYSSTVLQAKQGAIANNTFVQIKQDGLNAGEYIIKNSDNEIITIDQKGLNCKSESDLGFYGDCQLRLVGNGIYLTDDGYKTLRMAIGRGKYNGKWMYGVWADLLCGNLIVGNELDISNSNGSVQITGDGIKITNGTITWGHKNVNAPEIKDISGLNDYLEQLDGRIETYSQTNDPSNDWTTTELKEQHAGDIWLNPNDGLTKQWTGTEWIEITDSELKKLAESKAQVFTSQPEPPYYVGDLWVQGKYGDIKNCTTTRITGDFSSNDWVLSSKYTDDTEWKSWTSDTGDFGKYKETIKNQIDGKSNCTYGGSAPPSNPETGDLWFCTDGSGSYDANKAYMYNGSTWEESNGVPDSVWDIADGKSSIFVVKPDKVLSSVDSHYYYKGDIWILESDMTLNGKSYKKGSIMTSTSDSTEFDSTHWVEKVRYTDDTTAEEALKKAKTAIKDASDNLTLAKKYASEQDTTLSTNLTTAYKKYTQSEISSFDKAVADYLQIPGATTIIGGNHIIAPFIEGGYLNITNGNKQVIIDPNNKTNTGYIFQVHNDSEISIGIDSKGNATFNGNIIAKSLELGANKISTNNISGLSTVATSGKASDLTDISNYVTSTGLSNTLNNYAKSGDLETYLKTSDLSTKLNGLNVAYRGDVITTQSIDSSTGLITTTNKYTDSSGVSHEYTTYTYKDSNYVLLNRTNQWGYGDTLVKIEKDGLLTAKNAIIYGTIYATDGEFSGNVYAKQFEIYNDTEKRGQMDTGTFDGIPGVGFIDVVGANSYLGLGHTKSNGDVNLDYYIKVDKNYNGINVFTSSAIFNNKVAIGCDIDTNRALTVNGDIKTSGLMVFPNDYYIMTSPNGGLYFSGDLRTNGIVYPSDVKIGGHSLIRQTEVNSSGTHTIHIGWDAVDHKLCFFVDQTYIGSLKAGSNV